MIEASIDIGTNTVLLLVADVTISNGQRRISKVIYDAQKMVRLGQGVNQNRTFLPEAMERTFTALKEYAEIAEKEGVAPERIKAVATSASRDAKNSGEFYSRIQKELGIKVQIISGENEAKASFLGGLVDSINAEDAAILDIGGGSTEFVITHDSQILGESIDMGSVRATEMFLGANQETYTKPQVEKLEKSLRPYWEELSDELQEALKQKKWIGVAGTVTTLASVALNLKTFEVDRLHGYSLSRCDLADIFESLALQSNTERAANPMIGKGRADVITAGAAILLTAMEHYEVEEITVSIRGLRYGVLLLPSLSD